PNLSILYQPTALSLTLNLLLKYCPCETVDTARLFPKYLSTFPKSCLLIREHQKHLIIPLNIHSKHLQQINLSSCLSPLQLKLSSKQCMPLIISLKRNFLCFTIHPFSIIKNQI